MKKLFLILTFLIILTFFINKKVCAETQLEFGTNISGEFPNIAKYNGFVSDLKQAFDRAFKYEVDIVCSAVISQSSVMISNARKFTFGFDLKYIEGFSSVSDLEETKILEQSQAMSGFFALYIGFPITKNLSLFAHLGFALLSKLSTGISLLWKFTEKQHRLVKEYDEYGDLKTVKHVSSFFLSFSGFYTFRKLNENTRTDFLPGAEFNNASSFIVYGNGSNNITKFDLSIISFILNFKYLLRYKRFILNTGVGISVNIINKAEIYYSFENVNVNYQGSGAVDGADTSLTIRMNIDSYVSFMPFIFVGAGYRISDWFKIQAPKFSLIYLSTVKSISLEVNCSFHFLF